MERVPKERRRQRPRSLAWFGFGLLSVGVLLGAWLAAPSGAPARAVTHPQGPGSAPSDPTVQAQVVPSTATIEAGQSIILRLWTTPTANGCVVQPTAISWQPQPGPNPAGWLNATTGPSVNFTSFPTADNTAIIQVGVEGVVLCPGANYSFGYGTGAGLVVLPPLAVQGWDGPTSPVFPGVPVDLWGTVSGGCAPYSATIDFGDGNRTTVDLAAPGPFSVRHGFGTGGFSPSVQVRDALGVARSAIVANPVLVATSLVAGIVLPASLVDPGAPVALAEVASGGFPPYIVLWSDSEGNAGVGPDWTLPALPPGPDRIHLRLVDRLGESVDTNRTLTVALPLEANASSPASGGDVGRPVPTKIQVGGGVPPYEIIGSAEPSGSSFEFHTPVAGEFRTAVVPATESPLWLSVTVTDSSGATLSGQFFLGSVNALPFLLTNMTPTTGEVGAALHLAGIVVGGTPPLAWTVATTAALASSSPEEGSLASSGTFLWTGIPRDPGAAWFVTTLVDATGVAVTQNLSVRVVPPLTATLEPPPGNSTAGRPLNLTASIQGGLPPYRWGVSLSDGELIAGSSNLSGTVRISAIPRAMGVVTASLAVSDAIGATVAGGNRSVQIDAAATSPARPPGGGNGTPPASAGVPNTSWVPWIALPGFAVLGLWLYLRRQIPADAPSEPGRGTAFAIVRRLLREEGETDEETLVVLAEEQGIPPEELRRALRRWVSAGRVSKEDLGDGLVLYHWQRNEASSLTEPAEAEQEGAL